MAESERWWVFTFGAGQKHEGHYVKFFGTYDSAREKMIQKYGLAWGFQYSEEDWHRYQVEHWWPIETELKEDSDDNR